MTTTPVPPGKPPAHESLKHRSHRLIISSSLVILVTLSIALIIVLWGWTRDELTAIGSIELPELLNVLFATPQADSLMSAHDLAFYSAFDIIRTIAPFVGLILLAIALFNVFFLQRFSLTLTMGLIYAGAFPALILILLPPKPVQSEPTAFMQALEQRDYDALEEQLRLHSVASFQEGLYVLAQVAVMEQLSQAPTIAASFLEARSRSTDPLEVSEQRRYALEVAAHGQAVTVEGHAYLAKQLRNETVTKGALYLLAGIAVITLATLALGLSIRRRAVRMSKLVVPRAS